MPRKRTRGKRRLDAYSGAEAWADVFKFGRPIFDDFSLDTGVQTDRSGAVPIDKARSAWQAYGLAFLSLYDRETRGGEPAWALQQFGEPDAR